MILDELPGRLKNNKKMAKEDFLLDFKHSHCNILLSINNKYRRIEKIAQILPLNKKARFGFFYFRRWDKWGAEKKISYLSGKEVREIKAALGMALEIYGKGGLKAKQNALSILDGWGRVIFIVSNDGKRMGLELTERWEREKDR